MSLFQKSVINKYLKTLDSTEFEKSFLKFKEFYGNSARLENIRLLKEENYQEGFLREIFVQVLGYSINPDEDYNLTTEFKNLTDAKKADGAVLDEGKAIGVIELKSTKTTSLESITEQAFNYKNHQPNCRYIITSNFEKIRFYIDNATDFEEFNLFTLTEDDFKILYLILSKKSIFNEIPLKLKKESVLHEENISNQLYQDYSNFKRKIFNNLVQNNPQYDQLTLFKKSQKLLDRFLFILFGEDSGLVPPNAVTKIIDQWKTFTELDEPVTLYSRFIKLFHHLDIGHKYKTFEIPAYNGGLFGEDEILNAVLIDDEILLNDSVKLSTYDFQTEIDVNILGHIFENSLNEIEELTAELEGKAVDKKKTKRKKEGVYYTPKYITKYIVENTVGELCSQKKKELNLDKIDISIIQYSRTKQGKLNKKAIDLLARLKTYSEYLLSLKIIDPACGSGAFLNQALEFLIEEHQFVDEYRRQLEKDSLGLFDIKKSILENNIYGVDINEESVEIAKLSLWLRTAERGRKLSDLSNNIKCGNSLIDDQEFAVEKAFKWEDEFPEIMAYGGFDAVIGNPPYIKEATNKNAFDGLHNNICYQGKMDLWYFFGWLALKISKKETGLIGYIAPNNWITNDGASKFRNIILDNGKIIEFVDFGDFKVFDSVGIQTMILIMKKSFVNQNYELKYSKILNSKIDHARAQLFLEKTKDDNFDFFIAKIEKENFKNNPINFINNNLSIVINSIQAAQNFSLEPFEIASGIDLLQDFVNKNHKEKIEGVEIGDGIFNLSQREYKALNFTLKEKELLKPFYTTNELGRYFGNRHNRYWIIYTNSEFKDEEKIKPYPNIKAHLDRFKSVFTTVNKPYGLHRSREEKYFKGEKILSLRKCSGRPSFTYSDFDTYVNRTFMIIKTNRINQKYLVGLFNSTLFAFWLKLKGKMQGNNYQVDKNPLLNLPILKPDEESQSKLSEFVMQIIENKQKQFDYSNLLGLAKAENNFDREIQLSKELDKIVKTIAQFENKIDDFVYHLYELSGEEIQIIENSFENNGS